MTPAAPAPRPARGWSSGRAQRWILAAALVTAVTYAFRLLVEPSLKPAPARGGKAAQLFGAGSPPPPLGQWAVAFGAGFLMLSIVALAAPELAASLAMLELAGVVLTNGITLAADLGSLEGHSAAGGAIPLTGPSHANVSFPGGFGGPGAVAGNVVGQTGAAAEHFIGGGF